MAQRNHLILPHTAGTEALAAVTAAGSALMRDAARTRVKRGSASLDVGGRGNMPFDGG
jgi:hypothetical protein